MVAKRGAAANKKLNDSIDFFLNEEVQASFIVLGEVSPGRKKSMEDQFGLPEMKRSWTADAGRTPSKDGSIFDGNDMLSPAKMMTASGNFNLTLGHPYFLDLARGEVIGKGQFGVVLQCYDRRTGKLFALKILRVCTVSPGLFG
jgi:hypothetical protein